MRQFLIIGLGNFGATIAKSLTARGCQVLAIDISKDIVQDIKDDVTEAIVMDVKDKDAIKSLPVQATDIAIICLGDEMEISILATLYLKEMGINKIMVKGISADHAKILKFIGASDIIFPEQEMAFKIADRLAYPNVLDLVSLADGFSMAELLPLESFFGNSILKLDIRRKYGIAIVAIKNSIKDDQGNTIEKIKNIPSGDYVIDRGDILVIIGEDNYIEKYRRL